MRSFQREKRLKIFLKPSEKALKNKPETQNSVQPLERGKSLKNCVSLLRNEKLTLNRVLKSPKNGKKLATLT